jgi:hypothetical protein
MGKVRQGGVPYTDTEGGGFAAMKKNAEDAENTDFPCALCGYTLRLGQNLRSLRVVLMN